MTYILSNPLPSPAIAHFISDWVELREPGTDIESPPLTIISRETFDNHYQRIDTDHEQTG